MRITCSKLNLLNGINTVSKAVPSKSSMSILECILLEAKDDIISLTANDTEIAIKTEIMGSIEDEGMVALNAKMLMEIVRKLPDNDVTVTSDVSLITTIKCEKTALNIIGKDGKEFSSLPLYEKKDLIEISQYSLKEGIRQTIFSISENDSNKLMSSEYFEIKEDNLRIIALDGHRVAIRNIKLKNFYDEKSVIIPGKTLNELMKIIPGNPEETVKVFFDSNYIIFEYDSTIVLSRIVDGEYFPIDQMISNDYETKIKINRKDFQDCIDRTTLLVKEGDRRPVIIEITDNSMEIHINAPSASMDETVDIKKTGKDIMIGFNPRFLLDVLKVLEEDEIDIYMLSPMAPCFVRDVAGLYNYMILPVNFTTVE